MGSGWVVDLDERRELGKRLKDARIESENGSCDRVLIYCSIGDVGYGLLATGALY